MVRFSWVLFFSCLRLSLMEAVHRATISMVGQMAAVAGSLEQKQIFLEYKSWLESQAC